MEKYGEGLAKEIVKAVNNGDIKEPITIEEIKKLCLARGWKLVNNTVYSQLRNSSLNKGYEHTNKPHFWQIDKGKYIVLPKYRDLQLDKRIEDTKPEIYLTTTAKFKRNPDVVSKVLLRANGKCEKCKSNAPFIRKSDNTPYLEVHHKVSLSEGGDDILDNCIAVCPNCHRKLHYGE